MANFYGSLETDHDFQEEDIWETINAREIPKQETFISSDSSASSRRFTAATARAIPRATTAGSSAPVNVPDKWSKTLKKKACKNLCESDDEDMVPPHEYLARRLAATQIASFSMCEGVGRTLKGRDITKFRNDILSKTGFLE